jgi:hypothetical protein
LRVAGIDRQENRQQRRDETNGAIHGVSSPADFSGFP